METQLLYKDTFAKISDIQSGYYFSEKMKFYLF